MRNIEQILSEVEGLTDEQRESITKSVTENYRSIEEVIKKADRIAELEGKVAEYEESIGKLEGDNQELEALKAKVTEYEQAETKRNEEEAEQKKLTEFSNRFDEAVKNRKVGNQFANDMMRDSVLTKVRALCAENEGKGIEEAIEEVTKDVSGVWKNPQQQPHNMPSGTGNADTSEDDKRTMANFLRGII